MAKQAIGSGWNWRQHRGTVGVAAIAGVFGLAASLLVSGQERQPTQAPIITNRSTTTDTGLNLSPAGFQTGRTTARSQSPRLLPVSMSYNPQQSNQSYAPGQQAPAPIVRGNGTGNSPSNGDPASQNESLQYNTQPPLADQQGNGTDVPAAQNGNGDPSANATDDPNYVNAQGNVQEDAGYDALDEAQQTDQAPPPLPEYDQPPAPEDDYLWTPGYWGFNTGYYWVPGAWVAPPFYGALWTPPWWGFYGSRYFFHRGFWGTHIGYYGGINYGYGYVGSGYYGGYWQGRNFYYNRSVNNVNVGRVRYVYDRPVVINNVVHTGRSLNRTSFNGGSGGVHFQPRSYEVAAMREAHYAPLPAQVQSHRQAAANRGQFFSRNHGQPAEMFQQRPLSSPRAIADAPQRPPVNTQTYGEGNRATFGAGRPGETRAGEIRSGGNVGSSRPADTRGLGTTGSPAASEVNHPSLDNGTGNPRNDMIRQRTGLWGGDRERGVQAQQQPSGQPQSGSGGAQQQRDLRLQQQQQQDAARQGQHDVQQQQQGYRNQVFEQQRDARQQLQNQQQQVQQQQRQQQQDRNIQFQQQRLAMEQQRQAQQQQQGQVQQQQRQAYEQQRQVQQQQHQVQQQQMQQQRPQMAPQRIEARPAPQMSGGQGPGETHGRPH